MFKKDKIDLIYRVICLLTFIFVILFTKSFITLLVLAVFFFLTTYKEENFLYVILYLISFIFFFLSYYTDNYGILKLVMIINYTYYFLDIPSFSKMIDKEIDNVVDMKKKKERKTMEEKEEMDEMSYYRFTKKTKSSKVIRHDITLPETFYITIHLVILLLSIVVG